MNQAEVDSLVRAIPLVRTLLLPADQLNESIRTWTPYAVDEIVNSHEWSFVIKKTSTTSVIDQAEYTLSGANNDARTIINVSYDSNEIERWRARDVDWKLSGRATLTSVLGWYPSGRTKSGFPKIIIFGTPSAAKTIDYRYTRNNMTLTEFPSAYGYVVASGVVKRLVPGYTKQFDEDLANMQRQDDGAGAEGIHPILPEVVVNRNNERAKLNGYT